MTTHTTGSLAAALGAELVGPSSLKIARVETLDLAGPDAISFIRDADYAVKWPRSGAAAALVSRGVTPPGHDPTSRALLLVPDADQALVKLLGMMGEAAPAPFPGVHPSAQVDPSARVGPGASVGPLCIVGPGAEIGAGAVLHARVTVGAACRVGARSILYPGVVLYAHTVVGADVIIHANAVLGADGFGYLPAPDGKGLIKIPHIGNVEVGDGVEIGAGATIDRAKFGSTIIEPGVKIDNLVQIGHGCRVGRGAILCGQAGLAGSVKIGAGSMIGGQAGLADNIEIGPGSRVYAQAGLTKDFPARSLIFGTPGVEHSVAARHRRTVKKLCEVEDTLMEMIDWFRSRERGG